jgi:hypothetical protein
MKFTFGILVVVDDLYKFKMELKVLTYSEYNCVLELENPDNQKSNFLWL